MTIIPPQLAALIPSVVFALGGRFTWVSRVKTFDVGLSTNLLGAAVGGSFSAIGVEEVKDYLSKNVAIGVAFPTAGGTEMSGLVQLGLGQVTIPIWSRPLWPVLSMEQFGAGDARIPDAVTASDTTVGSWSTPSLSFGINPIWSLAEIRARLKDGKVSPIFTVSIISPYYFPGDPFEALLGIITGKRQDYQKAGGIGLTFGVGIPLIRPGGTPE